MNEWKKWKYNKQKFLTFTILLAVEHMTFKLDFSSPTIDLCTATTPIMHIDAYRLILSCRHLISHLRHSNTLMTAAMQNISVNHL